MFGIVAGILAFLIGFALAFILGKPQPAPRTGGILGLVENVTGLKV
jgi:hypothetical protein